eukprot:scaffold16558_cov89-Isochrysis_galbana.AAC.2
MWAGVAGRRPAIAPTAPGPVPCPPPVSPGAGGRPVPPGRYPTPATPPCRAPEALPAVLGRAERGRLTRPAEGSWESGTPSMDKSGGNREDASRRPMSAAPQALWPEVSAP